MRVAILALILSIPVSLTADVIGMAFGAEQEGAAPCATPARETPAVLPPKVENDKPVKRPSRRYLRTV